MRRSGIANDKHQNDQDVERGYASSKIGPQQGDREFVVVDQENKGHQRFEGHEHGDKSKPMEEAAYKGPNTDASAVVLHFLLLDGRITDVARVWKTSFGVACRGRLASAATILGIP